MQAKKKRLTLDMDPAFQRRLKSTAALKGVSMRQYCLSAIGNEIAKDEVGGKKAEQNDIPLSKRFNEVRDEVFGDRALPGNSADLVQEGREEKAAQPESAITGKYKTGNFDIEGLKALRKELFGDRVFPGNSADLLREARAIRDAEIEGWA